MSTADVREWICRTLLSNKEPRGAAGGVQTRGLADKRLLWTPGQELRISFLEGSKKLQDRVFETLLRWTSPEEGGANLELERAVNTESSDIRISFDEGGGSWSMIGTDARDVAAGQPTMNLGWATETTPENDFTSVVLHEFGHAIGLLHEHNHPELVLRWKKDVVYADLGGPPNNWSQEDIDFNVFLQYPLNRIVASDKPDLVSIMIYTIPSRWLSGQKAITPSDHLSKDDITFIRWLYG
jgi:hypothetical protein